MVLSSFLIALATTIRTHTVDERGSAHDAKQMHTHGNLDEKPTGRKNNAIICCFSLGCTLNATIAKCILLHADRRTVNQMHIRQVDSANNTKMNVHVHSLFITTTLSHLSIFFSLDCTI